MTKYTDIWTPSHCLSKSQLSGYLGGKLAPEEVYLVESHLNDCELCSDALDALMTEDPEQVREAVSAIKQSVEEKIRERFPTPQGKNTTTSRPLSGHPPTALKTWTNFSRRWAAAAAIVVVVALGAFAMYTYVKSHQQQLAQQTPDIPSGESASSPVVPPTDTGTKPLTAESSSKPTAAPVSPEPAKTVVKELTPIQQLTDAGDTKTEDVSNMDDQAFTEGVAAAKKDEAMPVSPVQSDLQAQPESEQPVSQSAKIAATQKQVLNEEKMIAKRSKADYGMSNSKPPSMLGNKNLSFSSNATNQVATVKESVTDEESAETSMEDPLAKGLEYYRQGAYSQCIPYLEAAVKKVRGEQKEDIQFYLARAYTQTGKNRKAVKMYEQLSKGTKYRQQATDELRRVTK